MSMDKHLGNSKQAFLKKNAPNIKIVGDELIQPFGKVQDFNPYITKIKLSGADTVLTGNWGPDAYRFVNALKDAGLKVKLYGIYICTIWYGRNG